MNSKGQALIIFVILLPIIFLIMAIVIDLGNLELQKQKITNEIKTSIKYGLNNIDKDNLEVDLQNMLDANIDGQKTITIENNIIKINVKSENKSVFNNIIQNKYDIDITYSGYITEGKIIIKE